MATGRARRRATTGPVAVLVVSLTVVAAACAPSTPDRPSAPPASPAADATLGPLFPPTATPGPSSAPSAVPDPRPLAGSGSIALEGSDGSLSLVDARGQVTLLVDASLGLYGFPAWSPDGSRIAALRSEDGVIAVVIIDVAQAGTGTSIPPVVIFQTPTVNPFYLFWHPDGKVVSFLADEAGDISLRDAAADGSMPVDGSGTGALIRKGSPFYFDWVGSDRLFAHIGDGADAFLGVIGIDGKPVGAAFPSPGSFRSPDVSADGKYVGYVRAGKAGTDAVVAATIDGSSEQSMPVVGLTAVGFSPTDDVLASIGSPRPVESSPGIPLGPLRLLDARTGGVRTLLDGEVITFDWSPDGKTIAAIRVVPVDAPASSAGTGLSSASTSPGPSASPRATIAIHLAFVDVATGRLRSDPEIAPASRYTNQVLTYFDQYALSHRMWSPDSSTLLVPQVDASGATRTDVFYPDGGDPKPLDAQIGFWTR
jgi:TolB protein